MRASSNVTTSSASTPAPEGATGIHGAGTRLPRSIPLEQVKGDWMLDPSASSIRFSSAVLGGLATVRGRFTDFDGSGSVAGSGEVTGVVRVRTASVDTGSRRRDAHLRSASFLDARHEPVARFELRETRPGDPAEVIGQLTIRDAARVVSLAATAPIAENGRIIVDAHATLRRDDFGMRWNVLGAVPERFELDVHAVFVR